MFSLKGLLKCHVVVLVAHAFVAVAGQEGDATCSSTPPDGVWTLFNFVKFPDDLGGETMTSISLLELKRDTDTAYSGTGAGLIRVEAVDFQPGDPISYTALGVYDNATRTMSLAIEADQLDSWSSLQWTYSCNAFTGIGTNAINGTVTPYKMRQEVTLALAL